MIYMHYCKNCNFLHMLSGHRTICPGCGNPLTELKIDYLEYYQMNQSDRHTLLKRCSDPAQLKELTFVYKKHKFSKWYKEGRSRR